MIVANRSGDHEFVVRAAYNLAIAGLTQGIMVKDRLNFQWGTS